MSLRIYAYYEGEVSVCVEMSTELDNVKVLKPRDADIKSFNTFKALCERFRITNDTAKWKGSKNLEDLEDGEGLDKLILELNTNNFIKTKQQDVIAKTTYLGKDEYESTIPPLNIHPVKLAEETIQKQALEIKEATKEVAKEALCETTLKVCVVNQIEKEHSIKNIDLDKFESSGLTVSEIINHKDYIYKKKVMIDILLTLNNSMCATLQGPSGMGKSTIENLVLHYFARFKEVYTIRIKASESNMNKFIDYSEIDDKGILRKYNGPFLNALNHLKNKPNSFVFIIIEEINHVDSEEMFKGIWELFNRGNSGDYIYLGDRKITKKEIQNLKILCTMNKSDTMLDTTRGAMIRRINPINMYYEDVEEDKLPNNIAKDLIIELNKNIDNKDLAFGIGYIFEYERDNRPLSSKNIALNRNLKQYLYGIERKLNLENENTFKACIDLINKKLDISEKDYDELISELEAFKYE